jgi:hypothetical protein
VPIRVTRRALRLLTALLVALIMVDGTITAAAETASARAEPLPGQPRTEVAGAYWEKHELVAVAGGFVPPSSPNDDLFLYDVTTREWRRGTDLPGNRDHAALVALDDAMYLVGGFTRGLAGATSNVWKLTTPAGTWKKVASMGAARGALGAVAVDGRLLAVGGVDENGRDLRSTEWYDPVANSWVPGPDLSRTRQHLGVAAVRNTVYAIGGRAPNLATVERLRFRDGTPAGAWRAAPQLQFSRSGNAAATVNGVVCTAGGEEELGTIAPVECLRNGRWRHATDLAAPRHGLAVVAVDDELHVVAGGPEPGFAFSGVHEVLQVRER